MKLTIGPANLQTEFEFEIFKKRGRFITVEGRLGHIDKVGVYVSGGLDSTTLLCLILTELRNTGMDIPVTCFTLAKSDGPTYHASNIVNQVRKHFDITLEHVTDIPNDPIPNSLGNIGIGPIRYVKNYAPNMIVYMGNNRMAPDNVRPFSQRLQVEYGHRINNPMYSSPFLFLHKPQILDIIYQLGCEDLIQYTQSCMVVPNGQCRQCYSCVERQWGFEALGKTDPGTLPKIS